MPASYHSSLGEGQWFFNNLLGFEPTEPDFFKLPQMQRVCVSTVNVLKSCHNWKGFRPFNFFMRPTISPMGVNVNPDDFALAVPTESDQTKWMQVRGINICDPEDKREYRITTDPMDCISSSDTIFISDFRYRAYTYIRHPEAKALAPDGTPCTGNTRGLLQRAHIVVDKVRRISKECDRRWEDGEDADAIEFEPPNYDKEEEKDSSGCSIAREQLIRTIKKIGFRELERQKCNRSTLQKICKREMVRNSLLNEYERKINLYRKELK
jgi:hypothetical protein